jgi:hypothetical protein
MKARFNLSVLFAMLVFAAPAKADLLTHVLIETSANLLSAASRAVYSTVKEAIVPNESAEDRRVRENAEIDRTAEQILAQYSEDQREIMRPEVMNRLTKVYVQYNSMEARQEAIRTEQNSLGNIVFNSTVGSAASVLGNRMAIDGADRSAMLRTRF